MGTLAGRPSCHGARIGVGSVRIRFPQRSDRAWHIDESASPQHSRMPWASAATNAKLSNPVAATKNTSSAYVDRYRVLRAEPAGTLPASGDGRHRKFKRSDQEQTLSAGVKNLFDRAPPFSNQNQANQTGYDPSYTDPHGRLYWAGIKYVFK
jgi:outer membrane receptor protein involved in Fe transport